MECPPFVVGFDVVLVDSSQNPGNYRQYLRMRC